MNTQNKTSVRIWMFKKSLEFGTFDKKSYRI